MHFCSVDLLLEMHHHPVRLMDFRHAEVCQWDVVEEKLYKLF